jgi:hypothetical protein
MRSRRACQRLAILAAAACSILWLAGHFLPIGLAFRNNVTLTTVRCSLNSSLTWRTETPVGSLLTPSGRGITPTLTICNRDAVVLLHRTYSSIPFDPARLHLPNLSIPLWALIAAFATIAYYLHSRAKSDRGLCARCAYNLAGLPAGTPCPECGRAAAPQS